MSKFNEKQLIDDLNDINAAANTTSTSLADFPFRLLAAYGMSETRIRRLKQDYPGPDLTGTVPDFILPKVIHYRAAQAGQDVDAVMSTLKTSQNPKKTPGKNSPRFLIVTDGIQLRIEDLKNGEALKGSTIADLEDEYDILLPLAGKERYVAPAEQEADVKAARHMRDIIDAVRAKNPIWKTEAYQPALNTFATRLLFCLYADDAGIFDRGWNPGNGKKPDQPFAAMLNSEAVRKDGGDTRAALEQAFKILDIPEGDPRRLSFAPRFQKLLYVNGDLFKDEHPIPDFDEKAYRALKRAVELDWKDINADIFGSMIQAVAGSEERSEFGMHYTSVSNIMKVIRPLFVEKLEAQLDEARRKNDRKGLEGFIQRLSKIHIFDPACGSGNFLIIAYREIRRLEREALAALGRGQLDLTRQSNIKLDHFHGIEPNDFACRTARLSLWISQIQADALMSEIGLTPAPMLPLHDAGDIHQGSALEIDWSLIVSPANTDNGEIYIIGNPPYLGSTYQTKEQKADMDRIFQGHLKNWRNLDFVAAWFKLMVDHIRDHGSQGALVTTNSLCQGESVPTFWPWVAKQNVEILSAHTSFKWANSAARNAGVSCAIIAMCRKDDPTAIKGDKCLHVVVGKGKEATLEKRQVQNINAYLIDGTDVIVEKASYPLSGLPNMIRGNQPTDGGHLLLNREERDSLVNSYPESEKFIKPILGSKELLHSLERFCIWIEDVDLIEALNIKPIAARIEKVRINRLASSKEQTREIAIRSHSFGENRGYFDESIIIPAVTSEGRDRLQIGTASNTICTNRCFMMNINNVYVFSILSTGIHNLWAKTVSGRLEDRLNYSSLITYNTFPIPNITDDRKKTLEVCARSIIKARRRYLDEGKTLAWLYSKDMPQELRSAHEALDLEYETMCIGRPFKDDAERLSWLFREYEKMKKRNDLSKSKR